MSKRWTATLVIVVFTALNIFSTGVFAATPDFQIHNSVASRFSEGELNKIKVAITAEYEAQLKLGFNPGNLMNGKDGMIHIWDDQGILCINIRFENGDSTATVFSKQGPWYAIFRNSWLGAFFQYEKWVVIFAVERYGEWYAYTLKNDLQDAAWAKRGFKDTAAPISNEFVDNEGNLVQNFQKGAVIIDDLDEFRRTKYHSSGRDYFIEGMYVEPPFGTPEPPVPGGPKYGDVNGDGSITNADLILLNRYIAGIHVEPFDVDNADVNADGIISNLDLILLKNFIAGRAVNLGPQWTQ